MDSHNAHAVLRFYLGRALDTLPTKLDGLSDYDVRRPLTPTATNLLGLVKHASACLIGYLGFTFDRPFPEAPEWLFGTGEDPNVDMWATPGESREDILELYRRARAHAEQTIDALSLDAAGVVPSWPPERQNVTLGHIMIHLLAELDRHNGHADILREYLDGQAGLASPGDNLPEINWADHYARVEAAAQRFR